jgi:hypothetical protein
MKRWILSVAILLAVILVIITVARKRTQPFGRSNTSFAVDNVSDIYSIELVSDKEELKLYTEDGKTWYVNEGRITRHSAIDFILKTISSIEIRSPMSDEMFQNEVIRKNLRPVQIKVFSRKRLLKSYIVYRTPDDSGGNVMMKSPSSKPYIVQIPGYNLNPGSHFVTDPKFWMPYTVFNLGQKEIETVEIIYPSEPDSSIILKSSLESFMILIGGAEAESIDTSSVIRFLSYFSFVPFENWAFDLNALEKERIINENQFVIIRVNTRKGESIILDSWIRLTGEGSDVMIDTDRLWGSLNGGEDIFIMRYFDLDPLIKTPDYFINE